MPIYTIVFRFFNNAFLKRLFGTLAFFISFTGFCQEFNFKHLDDGPAVECYRVYQDEKGFMWFTTEKGICRYDGRNFKWFNKDITGTVFHSVYQITETKDGDILFNTNDCSIRRIHNDSVIILPFSAKLSADFKYGRFQILGLYVDKEDVLWITTGKGLFKSSSPYYKDIKQVMPPSNSDSSQFIVKINKENVALNYISTLGMRTKDLGDKVLDHAMIERDGKTFVLPFYTYKAKMMPAYYKALALKNGNTLFTAEDRLITVYPDGQHTERVMDGNILWLYQDKEGGVWITYWKKGLAYYPDQSMNCTPIRSLAGEDISSVIEDSEGGIWASNISNGIFYAKTKYVINYNKINGLGGNIQCVFACNDKIMANNGGDFVTIIRGDEIKQMPFNTSFSPLVVYDNCIKGNRVYVAAGVTLKCDTGLHNYWSPVINKTYTNGFLSYAITGAPDGSVYAINYYKFLKLKGDTVIDSDTLPARGQSICVTHNGYIYIGCSNGLYKYENGNIIYLGKINKLFSSAIYTMKEDTSGNLWIGTTLYGIVVYKEGKVIANKTMDNGLASNKVVSITFDDKGNTWAVTDNGISKIIPTEEFRIENYDTRNGLVSASINSLAANGNNLWVASKQGLSVVDIAHFSKNLVPPAVYLNAIYVNDSIKYNRADFSYSLNNFRFHLSGLTYKNNKTRFLYRLIGIDTVWRFSDNEEITFNNLSSGKYRFEAKAVNADGIASLQAVTFPFVIRAPFWLRWWFIVLEILIASGIIYLFVRFRSDAIRAKEAEKSRINKMIAEYQMTALSAQMNPHFVFNAINSIQDYVLANDADKAYDYLTKFAQMVRLVLYNAKEKAITLEKELESLSMYVQLEQLRFENKFDFRLEIDKEVNLFDIEVPAMLIQPYVENAIWHGLMPLGNMRKGILKVHIRQSGRKLNIVIEDNGIGREESKKIKKSTVHKPMGMQITQSRIEVLNNLLGSTGSEINILDLYENHTPAGTRVEIKIIVNTD